MKHGQCIKCKETGERRVWVNGIGLLCGWCYSAYLSKWGR